MEGKFEVLEFGAIDSWDRYPGGGPKEGRKLIERDLPLENFGISLNSRVQGEEAGYWHTHSILEELYLFLQGEGEMAVGDQVIPVKPGTAVHVGQNIMRTWRCKPDSALPLRWICVRGGAGKLKDLLHDSKRADLPSLWAKEAK